MEFVFCRGQRSNWIERTEISIQFLCVQSRGRGDTERKDLQRRLYSDNLGLDLVHANAAGIDIGSESHFVAVAAARDAEPVSLEAGQRIWSAWRPG
jgi:hypothetical protein